ncbi:Ribosome Assembly protein, partial [Pseudoloma neurophilia]
MPENKLKQEEKINTKKQNFTNVSDNSNKRLRKKNSKSKNNEQPGNIELNNENVPNYGLNEQLEHIPEAYDYLEYINVEYPSQTICEINGNNLLFSQCNGSNSSLILANFKDLNANAQFTYDKMTVDSEINRIRRNNSVIVANSDHKGYIFNSEFNLRCEIHKSLSYGLDVTQEKAYFGTQAG